MSVCLASAGVGRPGTNGKGFIKNSRRATRELEDDEAAVSGEIYTPGILI